MVTRRIMLAGGAALLAAPAIAQNALDGAGFGLVAGSDADQSAALQAAMDEAAGRGLVLHLPAGRIRAQGLQMRSGLVLEGAPGLTIIRGDSDVTILAVEGLSQAIIRDVAFTGPASTHLIYLSNSDGVTLERCAFQGGAGVGINIYDAAATIRDCSFSDLGDAAIHAMDSRGLLVVGNRIEGCGNAGIRIWRGENGSDGSIVTGNHISRIDWVGGGNGQNGNGINVFLADEVIVADNHISDCAFTAVRLNSTNNCQVSGNLCLRSGEVAIFSEFSFSGSIISNNIIDGAAIGISITNLDTGGHLAVCSGNIVRNITPSSAVNPDTIPLGIFAEADTAITGNTVQNVPGVGVGAGWGTFLRNVAISGNVIADSHIGVGVSVVDGAGSVTLAGNSVGEMRDHAYAGLAWDEVVEGDLLANASRYPNVTIG
jgi:uncharacterized secreted repeat protein (TIGR03808 family)